MNIKQILVVSAFLFPTTANAVTLVTTSDPGFYNDSIGTVLNLTNGGETGPFPVSNDSTLNFPTAPNLSTAAPALGNWLTNPGSLNGNWTAEASIPNSWTPGDEVAIIYQFDTLGATNVQASFGVDNGIFACLDGAYIFGARAGYVVDITADTFIPGPPTAQISEPAPLAVLGLGLVALTFVRRRRSI